MNNSEKTFVLVHGAWHGAWSFKDTKLSLEAMGVKVVTIDLPGHGDDTTEISKISMAAYSEKVIETINLLEDKVILVGHSLAGFVVSEVAETINEKVEKLVFIAAMVPNDDKTVFNILSEDDEGKLLENLILSDDETWATVNSDTLKNVIYNGATSEQISFASTKLVKQATQPFFVSVKTSSKFNSIPKTYIVCSKDKVISPKAQQQLIDKCKIEKRLVLDTGHVPQIEKPIELAKTLFQV